MPTPSRPKLKQGSRVAIVSPASAAKAELVAQGSAALRAYGYDPIIMPHALERGPLYYAGAAADRVADLHDAFADPTIDAILCTRGGWGSAELLPRLDAELICANPKVFVGYSDHTSLHTWLWNECHLPTFYAPMVAADWSNPEGVDDRTWRSALHAESSWSVGPDDGLSILNVGSGDGPDDLQPGQATGRLLGGCLSILAESLGTPFAFRITEPTILFLEDINTKPYQWDRMLQHLHFAGLMPNVQGIVFGDMTANIQTAELPRLENACLHALRDFTGPIAIGLQSGHVNHRNRSIPLGAWVTMDQATLKESAPK
jgi:muramoyltetrapeptide carboxypeptidase